MYLYEYVGTGCVVRASHDEKELSASSTAGGAGGGAELSVGTDSRRSAVWWTGVTDPQW